jgi:tRNA (mo5U34)-methyltransferase
VLATDHWVWANHPWASRATIDLVREELAPALDIKDIDIPDLAPETVGTFDVVLFCGVFYHLRHPFRALAIVAPLARETLVLETHLDAMDVRRPAMIFYPTIELNGDGSNWWGPNRLCVEAMLRDIGFKRIVFEKHTHLRNRGTFRASR